MTKTERTQPQEQVDRYTKAGGGSSRFYNLVNRTKIFTCKLSVLTGGHFSSRGQTTQIKQRNTEGPVEALTKEG